MIVIVRSGHMNRSDFHYWFDLEMEILAAYDCNDYEYHDAYRHCFRVARSITFGFC